jgi:hypothetical protein
MNDGIPGSGVQFFPYENGNTVDANGIVTEAKGADIDGIAYLNEPSATNLYPWSDDITQTTYDTGVTFVDEETVTFTASTGRFGHGGLDVRPTGSTYILSFMAKADQDGATLRGQMGPYSDPLSLTDEVALTTEWERYAITYTQPFDNSSAGFLMGVGSPWYTLSLKNIQLELAPGPSSYIPTSGAPVTRGADYLKYIDVDINEDISFLVDQESLYESDGYTNGDLRLIGVPDLDPAIRVGGRDSGWSFNSNGGSGVPRPEVSTQERKRLVISWSSVSGLIALDGELKAKDATALTQPHSASDIYGVGHWPRTGDVYAGLFHRVMFFDEALSDEEALDLSGNEYACPEDK